jgi:cytochrome bd-type quinol oxidase subunit 2
MYLPVIVAAFLFSYWLFKKKYSVKPLKLPVDVQTGDAIHGAFGSLLANLSMHGMYVDVVVGILLYLAYQFAEFLRKNDTVDKDIATFVAGYFGTLIVGGIPL